MRFDLLARRITVLALGPALAVAVAACSSSSSTSAATSPSSSAASSPAASAPAASSSAPASSSSSGAAAQITANWEKFFSASTTPAQKAALLQNGSKFTSAISAFAQIPLASGIGAKVTKVVVTSSTEATVTYNIVAGGASLLSGKTGTSVYQDGGWKVGDASLCGLFTLIPGGTVPAACSSAG
jgi:cytoskeletal protein RodZ